MKKILTLLVAFVLAVSCFMLPTSALAVKADWTKATGPATLEMTEEGPTLSTVEGQSFAINSADMISVDGFECTFTVARDDDRQGHTVYLTLNMSRSHAGNNHGALFLILYFNDRYTLKMEGQILHTGLLLKPTYEYFSVDTTKPITVRGKIVDANHYSITVDGDSTGNYTFEIPENYPFHKILDGNAFFGFGIGGPTEWSEDLPTKYVTIKSVNGKDYTGLPEDAKDDKDNSGVATGNDTTVGTNNNGATVNNGRTTNNNMVIILLIVVAVVVVLLIAVVVFLVIYMKKQKKKEEERKARARAKKAARLVKEKAEAGEEAEDSAETEPSNEE